MHFVRKFFPVTGEFTLQFGLELHCDKVGQAWSRVSRIISLYWVYPHLRNDGEGALYGAMEDDPQKDTGNAEGGIY